MLSVVVNKSFKLTDSPSEEEENAREGIYWLIKASEQGHGEATVLLKECLETGKGEIALVFSVS